MTLWCFLGFLISGLEKHQVCIKISNGTRSKMTIINLFNFSSCDIMHKLMSKYLCDFVFLSNAISFVNPFFYKYSFFTILRSIVTKVEEALVKKWIENILHGVMFENEVFLSVFLNAKWTRGIRELAKLKISKFTSLI